MKTIATSASFQQQDLYSDVLQSWTDHSGRGPTVLDFGTGHCGAGRVFLQPKVDRMRGELHLFDPEAQILAPSTRSSRVVNSSEVYGHNREEYDIVNISYVLCNLDAKHAKHVLQELREAQPQALYVIVDYILAYRSKEQMAAIFQTDSERNARDKEGEDRFYATRGQHDVRSLHELITAGGLQRTSHAGLLDSFPSRAAFVASEAGFPAVKVRQREAQDAASLLHRLARRTNAMIAYAMGECTRRVQDPTLRSDIQGHARQLKQEILSIADLEAPIETQLAGYFEDPRFVQEACDLELLLESVVTDTNVRNPKIVMPKLKAEWDLSTIRNNYTTIKPRSSPVSPARTLPS